MPLKELIFFCPANTAETLEGVLLGLDALSVTLEDAQDEPILEPGVGETPVWPQVKLKALFDQAEDISLILDVCQRCLGGDLPLYECLDLEDQPWERAWLKYFKPMSFGSRLWIYPKEQVPEGSDKVIVALDPGLAFGTGTHPTTALCLRFLDAYDVEGKRVIDYGCGSGILGIAAAKLGAKAVWAVDYDPQALMATRDNADTNQLDPGRLKVSSPEDLPSDGVDLILANILVKPLQELMSRFLSLLDSKSGILVMSGILQSQIDDLLEVYRPCFEVLEIVNDQEWMRVVLSPRLPA